MDMAAKVDRLDLNECYSRALKAFHDMSASYSSSYLSLSPIFSSLYLFCMASLFFFFFCKQPST